MEQYDGAHGAAAPDRDARDDRVVARRVLDRRDHAQVDLAGVQQLGHPRGHLAADLEARVPCQAVDDRLDVQVGDDAEAELLTTP